MAFSNQFALSLELTRLLPINWATNKVAEAIMDRARDLRHSGSDIVVEEDLVNVFGRNRISPALTSSFKNIVAKNTSNTSLWEGITLQRGPGPTTLRALQEAPYFAMVIQLSLLVWTFEVQYLATTMADALRKRSEGAPLSSKLQTSPSRVGILGVLHVCERQTSAFNWNMLLHAVSRSLGYEAYKAPIDVPQFVFQGLLDMFPMVQTLPNDRFIQIQIPVGEWLECGTSTLVVWAHHVLDLNVLVRPLGRNGNAIPNVRFGRAGLEQVLIEEVATEDEAAITLLDSTKAHLLSIKPEPDAEYNLIGAVKRFPARGWGNAVLQDNISNLTISSKKPDAIVEDLQIVTSAFAFIVAKNLVRDDTERELGETDKENIDKRELILHEVDERRLLQTSRFLFDNSRLSQSNINTYVTQYTCKPLDEHLARPPALEAAARAHPSENSDIVVEDEWDIICRCARHLSVLLIALAHVSNLEEHDELMISGVYFSAMFEHSLVQQLEEWNGHSELRITDDTWLQAVAVPLLSHRQNVWNLPWKKVCLISERGWSAWISTFEGTDPAYLVRGSVTIGRGSPCRNGVWKTGIWDSQQLNRNFLTNPQRAETCGQTASLHCAEKVSLDSPYCGEGEDIFLICARFRFHRRVRQESFIQRVGYRELHNCLWWAQDTKRCSHGSRPNDSVKLSLDCITIAGFGHHLEETQERILIYLTAYSIGARWMALAQIPWTTVIGTENGIDKSVYQILLRRNDCCFQCAIDQAAERPGKWFIIL